MQLAGTALAAFLLFFVSQSNAQTEGSGVIVRVNIDGVSSDYYQGTCGYAGVAWGGAVTDAFCAPAKKVNDVLNSALVCDSIADGLLSGNIAVVDRGTCPLSDKALNAQKAGAVGILIIQAATNPVDNCVATTAGAGPEAPQVTIPVFVICRNIGNQITTALTAGKTVEICFVQPDIAVTSFFYTPSNVQTPASQIATDSFYFQATLSNNSATVARTNVKITAKVLASDDSEKYSTSITIPELSPGVVDSIFDLPGVYVPALPVGTYRILYTSSADPVGGVAPVEGRSFANFYVTQSVFAKENGLVGGIQPASVATEWGFGNVYTMSAGSLEDYEVKTVDFAFNNTSVPIADVQATFYFFRVKDDVQADWGNFDDTQFQSESFEWLGLGPYEAPDNIVAYSLQQVELTSLLGGPILLEAGVRYVVAAQYTPPYEKTFHAYDNSVQLPGLSTLVFTDSWGQFTSRPNAVLRMNIDLVVKTDEKPLPQSVMQIMPNPVRDNLNLALQFDQPTDATITIADINGRVVTFEDRQGLTNETLRYPLQVAAGTYLARIATKEGTLTKQFVVVK